MYDAEKESATSSDDGWQSWLGCFKTAPLGVSLRVFGAERVVYWREASPGAGMALSRAAYAAARWRVANLVIAVVTWRQRAASLCDGTNAHPT